MKGNPPPAGFKDPVRPGLTVLHILPSGFTRIRHYGFLSPRNKSTQLVRSSHPPRRSSRMWSCSNSAFGGDVTLCPASGQGHWQPIRGGPDRGSQCMARCRKPLTWTTWTGGRSVPLDLVRRVRGPSPCRPITPTWRKRLPIVPAV